MATRARDPQQRPGWGSPVTPYHQTDTIIMKVKADPTRRLVRGLRAATPPVLDQLRANARIVSATPVFDAPPASRVMRGLRAMGMPARGREAPGRRSEGLMAVKVDPGTNARQLARDLNKDHAEIEYAYTPAARYCLGRVADPLATPPWGHLAVRLDKARALRGFTDADQVVVAVVDSGVDRGHPALKHAIVDYQNFIAKAEGMADYVGHGTHVAGIIAARLAGSKKPGGVCAAQVLALKAIPQDDADWDAQAYYRALGHVIGRAKVLNLSIGSVEEDEGEKDIIADIIDAGIVVVAASGNEFDEGNPIEYPAAIKGVCAVAATDQKGRWAEFSNTGKHVAIAAPGVAILSTTPRAKCTMGKSRYDSWPGTSMATPFVSAAAALVLAKHPGWTPAKVIAHLQKKSAKLSWQRSRPNPKVGWGLLDIEAALR